MQAINTRIDTQAVAYQENLAAMTALVAELEANLAKSRRRN